MNSEYTGRISGKMFLPNFIFPSLSWLSNNFQVGKDYGVILVADRRSIFLALSGLWCSALAANGTQRMPGGIAFSGQVLEPCSVNAD